jgi:hypothetical protein
MRLARITREGIIGPNASAQLGQAGLLPDEGRNYDSKWALSEGALWATPGPVKGGLAAKGALRALRTGAGSRAAARGAGAGYERRYVQEVLNRYGFRPTPRSRLHRLRLMKPASPYTDGALVRFLLRRGLVRNSKLLDYELHEQFPSYGVLPEDVYSR